MNNDDGNMLKMFHLNPVYHLGYMDKTSQCPVNLQVTKQQLQDCQGEV